MVRELEQRHGRRAAGLLQQARQAHLQLPDAAVLTFCSRRARQQELRCAGMHKEAAAITVAGVDRDTLAHGSEAGRTLYLIYASADEIAAAGFDMQGLSPSALQVQVDRWMVMPADAPTDPLPPQLGAQAEAMRSARQHMRAGLWAAAAEALGGVDRRSPLAAWRLLSRALAAQRAGAHEAAAKSARQAAALASNFVLAPALVALIGEGAPPPAGAADARQRRQVVDLLQARSRLAARAGALLPRIRHADYDARRWHRDLHEVAAEICPEHVGVAVKALFLTLQVDLMRSDTGSWRLAREAHRAPIPGTGKELCAHLALLAGGLLNLAQDDHIETWSELTRLFGPGPFGQLVQAQLLAHLARQFEALEGSPEADDDDRDVAKVVAQRASGRRISGKLPTSIQLMQAAIAADPQDSKSYRVVDRALCAEDSPPAHALRLKLLAQMRRALPKDTYAYLALARAKLEDDAPAAALELLDQAAAFAGQDADVVNLRAIAQAQLAMQAAAKAPQYALEQLEQAARHCRSELRPYLQAARLAVQLDSGAMTSKALAAALASIPVTGLLRLVALVRCLSRRAVVQRQLAALLRRVAPAAERGAIASLFAPLPDQISLLFGDTAPVVTGMAPLLNKLLPHLTPAELLASAAPLLGGVGKRALRVELRRRRPTRRHAPAELAFLAYFIELCRDVSPLLLRRIIELVVLQDEATGARLAVAAAALAPLAPEPARAILCRLELLRKSGSEVFDIAAAEHDDDGFDWDDDEDDDDEDD